MAYDAVCAGITPCPRKQLRDVKRNKVGERNAFDYYFIDKELARAICAMSDNVSNHGIDTEYVYEVY